MDDTGPQAGSGHFLGSAGTISQPDSRPRPRNAPMGEGRDMIIQVHGRTGQVRTLDLSKVIPLEVRLACILAYEMALLPSEIVRLKKSDFRGSKLVCGSLRRRRRLPINQKLSGFIQMHPQVIHHGSRYIFRASRSKSPMNVDVLKWRIRRALKSIGIKGVTLMSLRRDAIHAMTRKIRSTRILSQNLGFTTPQSSNRYIQLAGEKQRELEFNLDARANRLPMSIRMVRIAASGV